MWLLPGSWWLSWLFPWFTSSARAPPAFWHHIKKPGTYPPKAISSVMVVSNWIRNDSPTCQSPNVCHAVFLTPILFTGSNNVFVTCKFDINGKEDSLFVYLFWIRSHSCLCREHQCLMPAPVLFSEFLSVCWQIHCVMKCHAVACYRASSNSSFLLYFYLSILDNLCNGKFHKHLQDLFAPLVVRYVDLMESSIAQSIHRGFERESWEPVK